VWAKIDAPPSLGGEYLQRLKGLEEQREFLCNTVKNTLENHDLVWFEGKYGQSGRALDAEARKTQAIWIREARDLKPFGFNLRHFPQLGSSSSTRWV
jgi:hypothetical protein